MKVLVVGAGIMGGGIAQVAAQAGHAVRLFDLREGAAATAVAKLADSLRTLAAKGKLSSADAEAAIGRIEPAATLEAARDTDLVVEAIVENLEAKRTLFRQLEGLVAPTAILATNTSSISVTAIANGLQHPGRLVGMHFFNPVPLMKLVEVVSGLHTDAGVAATIFDLAGAWGKTAVHARSTPGFIVNRIARPYYAETLALLQERAAAPEVIDACLRGAGFRMGPCELMDLIGHDTNFAVTQSVYEANFYDKRYQPSLVQRELVDAGWLGRKSGRGFYAYPAGAPAIASAPPAPVPVPADAVIHGDDAVARRLAAAAPSCRRERGSPWTGIRHGAAALVLTDGRTAQAMARSLDLDDVGVFDRPVGSATGAPLACSFAPRAGEAFQREATGWLASLGVAPLPIADVPGLVVARTVAMLINEAADAVQQGVCTPEGADAAMKLGVNYPAGPFEWLGAWGAAGVCALLDALDAHHRGERYRASPWLRARA